MQALHEILVHSADLHAERTALIEEGGASITYSGLHTSAVSYAAILNQHGLGQHKRIGVLLPKSIHSIMAFLGASMNGATYIPLDIDSPSARNLLILKDCEFHALLTNPETAAEYATELPENHQRIELEAFGLVLFLLRDVTEVEAHLEGTTPLAFLLYTSGSTGIPKGVPFTHANALSFVEWGSQAFHFHENDKLGSIAPFHFDLSVFDIYVTLKHGACLYIFSRKSAQNPMLIAKLLDTEKITACYCTPTMLTLLLNYGKLDRLDHSALRYVFFAGEVFPVKHLRKLMAAWPQAEYANLYGPTETNVCTYYRVPNPLPEAIENLPIGFTCEHLQSKVLSEGDNSSGELLISGPAVMQGYWKRPEVNEKAFLIADNGTKWYKTGDLVDLNEQGEYLFLGRKDRMVKRRGYRIELDEVENAMRKHSAIEASAVVATKGDDQNVAIIAFFKLFPGKEVPPALELKTHCLDYVPSYMLPDKFLEIEAIPMTSTQKVNYQQLLQSV
ncbi:MAG TPA: amino acid adenylation domain-containing protein [Saprospiraceae bacterium]|nr:amino acid adenylation domain-containing protein [Saprospiraceae bacterium]HMQ82648.1 amino acid adenylation domain-containing protein [Saprospiraceae bacterium]